jgi:hypothetical protein
MKSEASIKLGINSSISEEESFLVVPNNFHSKTTRAQNGMCSKCIFLIDVDIFALKTIEQLIEMTVTNRDDLMLFSFQDPLVALRKLYALTKMPYPDDDPNISKQ